MEHPVVDRRSKTSNIGMPLASLDFLGLAGRLLMLACSRCRGEVGGFGLLCVLFVDPVVEHGSW